MERSGSGVRTRSSDRRQSTSGGARRGSRGPFVTANSRAAQGAESCVLARAQQAKYRIHAAFRQVALDAMLSPHLIDFRRVLQTAEATLNSPVLTVLLQVANQRVSVAKIVDRQFCRSVSHAGLKCHKPGGKGIRKPL